MGKEKKLIEGYPRLRSARVLRGAVATLGAGAAVFAGLHGRAQYERVIDWAAPAGVMPAEALRDGTFTGPAEAIASGDVQVTVTVSNGQIVGVDADYPTGNRQSRLRNYDAIPELVGQAIGRQTGDLNFVTGATNTSRAFTASLQAALAEAAAH
ncbi:MAG: FMN-binding protein [Cellulomonadaceae bacterium]|jgi:uncharacterized protein with FMN-binding domain|nr:FMN-binding protein [Cellulomonadaceae bacterium]